MRVNETLKENVPPATMSGGIGRKWSVDGWTKYPEDFAVVEVQVEYVRDETAGNVIALARHHENGHAAVASDMILNSNPKNAWKMLGKYDRWTNEVEAWMRGLESAVIDFNDVMFILDCLNTYRRGIPATEEQWDEARELIAATYHGPRNDVFNYVPLEPDPNDPPPRGCLPQFGDPFGHDEGTPGDGDENGGGKDEEGENEKNKPDGEAGEENPHDNPFDNRWLQQDVLDDVAGGMSIADAAKKYDLDPTRLPPLLDALR